MDYVWAHGPVSAEACRTGLKNTWPMKDSTVRTVLTRLERKGFVTHTVEGRAFLYRATELKTGVAARAVRHIIDRFCSGSAEELVMGLVDQNVLTPRQLDRLARMVADRSRRKP